MADTGTRALRDIVRSADLLAETRKKLEDVRRDDMREWTLNREFFKGNQWSWWNPTLGQVDSLTPTNDGNDSRHKVRLVSNEIMPGVLNVVAQLTKTRPVIHATPNSGAERDAKAAELGEALYDWWWSDLRLKSKLQMALLHAQLSEGYWKISWDNLAGKQMTVMLDPQDGRPITDGELADAYKDELLAQAEQSGMDGQQLLAQFQRTVMMGDIRVEVMSGESVLIDPTAATFDDATYAICIHPLSPDEIKARWNETVEPNSIPRGRPLTMTMLKPDMAADEQERSTRDVYIGYFRPSPALPKGRYVAWVEGPNKILAQSDWPYPFTELPLVKMPGIPNPTSIRDMPRVSQARGLNKELNRTLSQVVMHKNLTLKPQMVAPVGSMRQRPTDEPGALMEYQPIAGLAPEWRPLPNLPSYVYESIADIQNRINRIFNSIPTERSQLPPRVDAGYAVELLQEAVADQLSPEIQRIEEALVRAGHLMATLASKFYIEPRLLKIKGAAGSTQVKKFMNSDIQGGFGYHAEAGSGLPNSRVGRLMQIKELVAMQALSPQEALPYLGITNLKGIAEKVAADEDHAYREIEKLIVGQPTNPAEMMNAVQAVQSGQPNPETGQPFQSPQEAQQFVQNAGLKPLMYENMQVHLDVLGKYMLGAEFEKLPPEAQERFLTHFANTRQALMSLPQIPQPKPVATTLSLKGTVGPTVASEILQRSGVLAATPQQLMEPPLETSVYDSIDKSDGSAAGNNPLTDMEQLQAMQQADEQHTLTTARSQHEVALAHQRLAHTEEAHQQSIQHEAERHVQTLANTQEQHLAKLRAAAAAKSKPQKKAA